MNTEPHDDGTRIDVLPATAEHYSAYESDEGIVVYDTRNDHAWIESDLFVDLGR